MLLIKPSTQCYLYRYVLALYTYYNSMHFISSDSLSSSVTIQSNPIQSILREWGVTQYPMSHSDALGMLLFLLVWGIQKIKFNLYVCIYCMFMSDSFVCVTGWRGKLWKALPDLGFERAGFGLCFVGWRMMSSRVRRQAIRRVNNGPHSGCKMI